MFEKTMVQRLAAVALPVILFGGTARAHVVLPTSQQLQSLGATQYQIAFVTSGETDGYSSNIADYNSFVTSQAALSSSLPAGLTWYAIVDTPHFDFFAGQSANVPIFNTAGQLVVSGSAQFRGSLIGSAQLTNPIDFTQTGGSISNALTWTGASNLSPSLLSPQQGPGGGLNMGSTASVTSQTTNVVGPTRGIATATDSRWFADTLALTPPDPRAEGNSLYALSSPITVASAGGGPGTVGGAQTLFPNVTTPGTLASSFTEPSTPQQLQQAIGAIAAGQIAFALAGSTSQLWDLNYSGTFTGDADVTLAFDPSLLGATPLSELMIEHYENGTWVVPGNQIIDPVNDTITFTTDGFSPFILAQAPEPGTIGLLSSALLGLGVVYLRRRGAKA